MLVKGATGVYGITRAGSVELVILKFVKVKHTRNIIKHSTF